MLGRIKYEQINSMIEELNTITVSKYKIIDTPVNKLNSENMRRFNVSLAIINLSHSFELNIGQKRSETKYPAYVKFY